MSRSDNWSNIDRLRLPEIWVRKSAAHADSLFLLVYVERVISYRSLIRILRRTTAPKNPTGLPNELIENDAHLVKQRRSSTLDSVDLAYVIMDDAWNNLKRALSKFPNMLVNNNNRHEPMNAITGWK